MLNPTYRYRAIIVIISVTVLICTCITSKVAYGAQSSAIDQKAPIRIEQYRPSTWDLPVGAYLIPNTSFVLFNENKTISTGFSAIFGPLGVIAANEAGKTAASESLPKDGLQLVDLDDMAKAIIRDKLNSLEQYAQFGLGEGETERPRYILSPMVWITIDKRDEIRVDVAVDVQFRDASGVNRLKKRYRALAATDRPLVGEGGWFANRGRRLNDAAEMGLEQALGRFLDNALEIAKSEGDESAGEWNQLKANRWATIRNAELEAAGGANCSATDAEATAETYFRRGKILVAMNEYKSAMVCFLLAQEKEKNTNIYRESCSAIGTMYELGWGVEQNASVARDWYGKAGL